MSSDPPDKRRSVSRIMSELLDALGYETLAADTRAQGLRSGIVGSVITVVIVGVVSLVSVLIMSEVSASVTLPADSSLGSTRDSLVSGFGDAIELMGIVMITLVASLVIAVIAVFR